MRTQNVSEKLKDALDILYDARLKISDAENNARKVLRKILEPVGEKGVTITSVDSSRGEEYQSIAEVRPFDFRPVMSVRYWNGGLEVFIGSYDKNGNVSDEGEWVSYETAYLDTWFLLDEVEANLEWADGYMEEQK